MQIPDLLLKAWPTLCGWAFAWRSFCWSCSSRFYVQKQEEVAASGWYLLLQTCLCAQGVKIDWHWCPHHACSTLRGISANKALTVPWDCWYSKTDNNKMTSNSREVFVSGSANFIPRFQMMPFSYEGDASHKTTTKQRVEHHCWLILLASVQF